MIIPGRVDNTPVAPNSRVGMECVPPMAENPDPLC
jgi:hypothetical protein